MTTSYIQSGDSITFNVKGVGTYSVDNTHPNYGVILHGLANQSRSAAELIELASPVGAVNSAVEKAVARSAGVEGNRLAAGTVAVDANGVTFDGEPVHGVLVDRILGLVRQGLKVEPWLAFMTNLYQNPSLTARRELYLWLETSMLPLTPDGCFLAFKKVNGDFTDIFTGSLNYSPGSVVTMPRHLVDDNREVTCSDGLHFCSASYLPHFGVGTGNKIVLVKINPADVVSIPSDYANAKGRAWRIEVLEDVTDEYADIAWPAVAASYSDQSADYDDDDDDYTCGCGDPYCTYYSDGNGDPEEEPLTVVLDAEDVFNALLDLIDGATDEELGFEPLERDSGL